MNSGLDFCDSISVQWRNSFDEICLKHLERGVCYALDELPVGGEEEHSLAHFVESSGEIEFVRVVMDEVKNGFFGVGVGVGGGISWRFIEHDIAVAGDGFNGVAVEGDDVIIGDG